MHTPRFNRRCSKPTNPLLEKLYDTYSFNVLPAIGKLVTGDKDSYQYLVESIEMHPDQQTLSNMMEAAGFSRVRYNNLLNGIAAIHEGVKPREVREK